jgi:small-conductance mechanosensitive channel
LKHRIVGKPCTFAQYGKSVLIIQLTDEAILRTMRGMESFLSTMFLGRSVATLITSAAVLIGGGLLTLLVRAVATALLRRRGQREDKETAGMVAFGFRTVRSFVFPSLLLATIYAAASILKLEGSARVVTDGIIVVLFSLMTIRFVIVVVDAFFRRASEREGPLDMSRLRPLRSLSVFVVWIAGLLFLLDNLGFDITAVVAGLGIGGIAVALAAQAVLGDLFGYFVILFDRPFNLGDFLIVGDLMGSVEKIGVKTTRLRSAWGEQISVSNSDLTGSRVHNYGRMEKRRVVFHLRVRYGTPVEKLRLIPDIVAEVIGAEEMAAFDRAHFAAYGDWNLSFEVVYNVIAPDYRLYMDMQQRMNLAIYERFEAEGIEFAIPSQTVNLEGPAGSETPAP